MTNSSVTYWVEMSDYDLETARAMLSTQRYLYVAFMCHQVIEKSLKAYWSKVLPMPPLEIHNLSRLAEKSGIDTYMSDRQKDLIDSLEPMNIEARYPAYKERLLRSLTDEYCKELIKQTEELASWIKSKL